MTHRFLVYPLIVLTVMLLWPLWRGAPRWFLSLILQHLVVLALAVGALVFDDGAWWAGAAGLAFAAAVIAPRWVLRRAGRALREGRWAAATRGWRLAGALIGGQHGALLRRQAGVWSREIGPHVPAIVRGDVYLWHLWACLARQEWQRAIAAYESTDGWGTLGAAMQARLAIAPAYAATGRIGTALRCLLFVGASPRTVGALAAQWWRERCRVAVAAGDTEELERLLAGRPATAETQQWREQCRARTGELTDEYRQMRSLLRLVEAQMKPWRALMNWWPPARWSSVGVAGLAAVFAVDVVGWRWLRGEYLWDGLGNMPGALAAGEWWRPLTALALHANALHLAMNALALAVFGTALERAWGAGRMAAIFLWAGLAGNIASAWRDGFEVSVGASSGVFGLVAAFGVALYRWRSPVTTGLQRRLLAGLALIVGVDVLVGWVEPQIDNIAHVVGALAGATLAWALTPKEWTRLPAVSIVGRA